MMSLLREKFEVFQQYSIDECFAEYTEEMQEKY
jgi:nucleotidyltransferase/DNA polymerase involved in DNA repair